MSTISLKSNIPSFAAQRRLGQTTRDINQSFERLSSGLRINRAVDDAAGLAIASGLNTDARVYSQGIRNLNDGLSVVNVIDGALSELSNITIRIRELSEQSANGSLSNEQRQALDEEAQELSTEFTRILNTTEMNGLKVLDGSITEITLQAGYGTEGSLSLELGGSSVVGTGTFGAATSYADYNINFSTALGDLNDDGRIDIVNGIASLGNENVVVKLGVGDGTFSSATSYASQPWYFLYDVDLEDLDGDGVQDIVAAGENGLGSGGEAFVLLGVGDGSFGTATSYSMEIGGSYGLSLGDLNGDGNVDLVTAGTDNFNNGFATVRLGAGDGTFGAATSYATEVNASEGLSLGDLNNDGELDLVSAGRGFGGNGFATVRLGAGDGTFGAATSFATESNGSNSITLGDLNSDGILDLVTAGESDGTDGYATVRFGVGDGTFGSATSYETENNESQAVILEDINGDSVLDLITGGTDDGSDSRVTIRLGNEDGTFGQATSYFQAVTSKSYDVKLADLNADGVLDLVTAEENGSTVVRLGESQESITGLSAISSFSLSTRSGALASMSILDRKIEEIASQRGTIGAFQSRIQVAINNLEVSSTSIREAESRIRDIDVATETANLTRLNILQQAGAAILSQANIGPQLALRLLADV